MAILKTGTQPIEKLLDDIKNNSDIFNNFIPLAIDEDNDYFYWDKTTSEVYYLSHENIENPIKICNSVEEFFKLLNYSLEKM